MPWKSLFALAVAQGNNANIIRLWATIGADRNLEHLVVELYHKYEHQLLSALKESNRCSVNNPKAYEPFQDLAEVVACIVVNSNDREHKKT